MGGTELSQQPSGGVKIARISAEVYRVPIDNPVTTSFGSMTSRPAVFVRIEDADGGFGWGEIFSNWPTAGAEHRARLLMEDISDLVLGFEAAAPGDLFPVLVKRTHIRALQCGEWGPFAAVVSGLDIALYDLFARRAGVPVAGLLAGEYADAVPTYASGIHIKSADRLIDAARADGYVNFKVKIGFDLDEDIADIRRVCGALQAGETLLSDANQAWDADTAETFVYGIGDTPLGWLEEPIPADAPREDWERVAAAGSVPIAGGENIVGLDAFEDWARSGVFGVMQPDVIKWGGITGCLAAAKAIMAAGRRYCPHYLGSGVGLTASAHLLAAVGGDGILEIDANPNPLREAFLHDAGPRRLLAVADAPGLGIDTLPEELDRYKTLSLERAL